MNSALVQKSLYGPARDSNVDSIAVNSAMA